MDPATSGLRRVVTGEFIAFRPSSFLIYSVSLVLIPHCLFFFQILMSKCYFYPRDLFVNLTHRYNAFS